MPPHGLPALIATLQRVLDDTEGEYAQMPFFVRPMVRRGFVKRSGRDFAAWRSALTAAEHGVIGADLATGLAALAAHYQGAPARARRGMGATGAQLEEIERRSRTRAEAALTLRAALIAD